MRVGLTPYADTPFNRASFPLKTLEYLAAGLPVVSSDLPASRAFGTELVARASTPTGYAELVQRALTTPLDAQRRAAHRTAAASHDWAHRAQDVLDLLQLPEQVPARIETSWVADGP